jgi:hypothetical protein
MVQGVLRFKGLKVQGVHGSRDIRFKGSKGLKVQGV